MPLEEDTLKNVAVEKEFTTDILIKLEVENALEHLPDELQEVVRLYFFQNLKLTEIADILKIGLPLVKYRMRQAKTQLKKYLEEDETK